MASPFGAPRLGRLRPDDPATVGPYTLVGRLATGGMGTVYAARGEGFAGYVAVKVVHPDRADDPRFLEQFTGEARLTARINSPCVPRFVSADVTARPAWIATEFAAGPTLRHRVERRGALRGERLLLLALGAAEALRAIHAAGVVHRDLKPSNVILGVAGPKVVDFGIARAPQDATRWLRLRRLRHQLRRRGIDAAEARPAPSPAARIRPDRLGTPGWISPEQYRGEPAGEASDVFLWGGVVAFAAARRNPFGHAAPRELARRVRDEEPDLAGLPQALDGLVRRALAKNPPDRPDAGELVAALIECHTDGSEPAGGPQTVARILRRDWRPIQATLPRPPRRRLRDWVRDPKVSSY